MQLDDDEISNFLHKLESNEIVPSLEDEEIQTCSHCGGRKWIIIDNKTCPCPLCLEQEIKDKKTENIIKNCGIKSKFRNFSFKTYPKNGDKDALLKTIQWASSGGNYSIIFSGRVGTGKTSLGWCAAQYRIFHNLTDFLFVHYLDLIEMLHTFKDDTAEKTMRRAKEVPLLMLDEIGVGKDTDWRDEQILSIIGHRHDEEMPTIITTNVEWGNISEKFGPRVFWRLDEMCGPWLVKMNGDNLRDREYAK